VFGRFFRLLAERLGSAEHRPPSGQVLLWLVRGLFGAIVIGVAMIAFRHYAVDTGDTFSAWVAFFAILAVGLLVVVTDVLVRNKQITTLSALYFGLLLGLLLGNILSTALEPFLFEWDAPRSGTTPVVVHVTFPSDAKGPDGQPERTLSATTPPRPADVSDRERDQTKRRRALALLITVVCCYVCISTLLQTKDEFRFIIPYVEFSRQIKGPKALVLDTSVIIDGRIADICDTRFLDTKMIVPRFVLQELQSVADSSDKLKRNRGRRGLDMLKRMQSNPKIDLQIHEGNLPELRETTKVDERLVTFAKVVGARVVTNDYNLNKIAQLQGVEVINLNELANALKSVALPGETMTVKLVKHGEPPTQGVGYLDDGTMVVVEHGRPYIGSEVNITVTSVLQTPAGRMIFGRLDVRPPGTTGSGSHAPVGGGRPAEGGDQGK
jgi:uncharacterized protein YacL